MRNLKKILALVLALVMSLSLMAAASADDELNLGDVSEVYAESVDVLTGLKVFQGNKGSFLPKDNITRAEVAAIIYRIVTGDVNDTQKGIYADYNKFSDVTSDAWYAGYVNYCANAEYVKGVGYDANGKAMFKPQQNVTGYEALAMILRAIGYDKNNEFTGPSWQIQTAATARNRGILKNIAEGTLGTAATREAVAEILCQTILVPVADYSLAFGYRTTDANGKDNPTLAYTTFKMEKIEGVVMANEYADLESTSPLAAGQTKLDTKDGPYTMNVGSDLDDLGESRYVYVIPQTGSVRYDLVCSKVYDTGKNNVYDSGDEVKTVGDSTGKDNGITSIAGAQHLRNYSPMTDDVSDWRIEYVIKLGVSEYVAKTMFRDNGNAGNSKLTYIGSNPGNDVDAAAANTEIPYSAVSGKDGSGWNRTYSAAADGTYNYEYRKVIVVGAEITAQDRTNIETIFSKSTHVAAVAGDINPIGEVYVGTSTRYNEDDISNKISHAQFVETYLKTKDNTIGYNGLGNRLKIVDNDNNGVAEYVLQTVYTVAIVTGTGSKITLDTANVDFDKTSETNSGVCHSTHTVTPLNHAVDNCNQITTSTKTAVYGDGEIVTGDVVLYALIDGTALMEKAEGTTAKIDKVVRTARTATTVDGEEYKESAVHEHSSTLTHTVANLVGNTTYNLYFDKYGNLAAFTEGTNGDFVLITDGWFDSRKAGDEYAVRAYIDGSLQTVDVTANGSLFIGGRSGVVHQNGLNNDWGMLKDLKDLNDEGHDVHTTIAQIQDGALVPVDKSYLYSQTVRMLEMQQNVIPGRDNQAASKARVHTTDYLDSDAYSVTADPNWYEVRALSSTVYYTVYNYYNSNNVAYNTVVRQYTGYSNVPAISRDAIEDVYAIGKRAQDANGNFYYTADIVVIELDHDYTKRDSEQVFIPEFSTVGTAVGREEVTMIRGNGELDTVTVDLLQSTIRGYDPADNTRTTFGGLYFMDESDTEKGVYILNKMDQADIQASNYAIGFVRANTAVAGEDWTSVDLYTNINGVLTPYQGSGITGNDVSFLARRHTSASHYYTLGYDGIYNNDSRNLKANLSEVDSKYAALEQNPSADLSKIDQAEDQLNETSQGQGRKNHLNEVLMAYNDAGDIIYTVSFREYRTGTTRDFAQTLWLWCMPKSYDATSGNGPVVAFYGEDNRTNISWGAAVASASQSIVVRPGANNTISSVRLVSATAGSTSVANLEYLNADVDGRYTMPITPVTGGATYVIDVVYPQGNGVNVTERFTLVQAPKDNALGKLMSSDTTGKIIVTDPDSDPIQVYVKDPAVTKLSTLAEYLKKTTTGADVTLKAFDQFGNELDLNNEAVDNAQTITATVTNGDVTAAWDINAIGTAPAGKHIVILDGNGYDLKVYDAAAMTPADDITPDSSILLANNGANLWITVEAEGIFAVTTTGSAAVTAVRNGNNSTVVMVGNVDANVTITFTPADAVNGRIDSVELSVLAKQAGAVLTGTVAGNDLVITLPDAADLPVTGTNDLAAFWFGDVGEIGAACGLVTGTGNISGYLTTADEGYASAFMIEAEGVNGGTTASVKVNFKVATEKVYGIYFNMSSTSGNVNIALKDLGTNTWLTNSDLNALGILDKTVTITRTPVLMDAVSGVEPAGPTTIGTSTGISLISGGATAGNIFTSENLAGAAAFKAEGVKDGSAILLKKADRAIYAGGSLVTASGTITAGDSTTWDPSIGTSVMIDIKIDGLNTLLMDGAVDGSNIT